MLEHLVHPEERERAEQRVAEARATGAAVRFEARVRTRDGSDGWAVFSVAPSRDRADALVIAALDIGKRDLPRGRRTARRAPPPREEARREHARGRPRRCLAPRDAGGGLLRAHPRRAGAPHGGAPGVMASEVRGSRDAPASSPPSSIASSIPASSNVRISECARHRIGWEDLLTRRRRGRAPGPRRSGGLCEDARGGVSNPTLNPPRPPLKCAWKAGRPRWHVPCEGLRRPLAPEPSSHPWRPLLPNFRPRDWAPPPTWQGGGSGRVAPRCARWCPTRRPTWASRSCWPSR